MRVLALVGKSGTGKSHHALMVAKKEKIEAIIDDGLLISSNKVLAGSSAKREQTKIASVKRALFTDKNHVMEVKQALKKNNINSLLILGTSEEMVSRIAQKIGAEKFERIIHIEEISSPEEIEKAQEMRMTQGKHIIPVPTFEIKKDFSGYFLHPLRMFKKNKNEKEEILDKTVMRPTYSYMGDYTISDNAISLMVIYLSDKCNGVVKTGNVMVNSMSNETKISLTVSLEYGCNIKKVCDDISGSIISGIDKMTAINISKVNIFVKSLVID